MWLASGCAAKREHMGVHLDHASQPSILPRLGQRTTTPSLNSGRLAGGLGAAATMRLAVEHTIPRHSDCWMILLDCRRQKRFF